MTIWSRTGIILAGVRFAGPGNVNTIHLQKVFSRNDIITIIITITIKDLQMKRLFKAIIGRLQRKKIHIVKNLGIEHFLSKGKAIYSK